MKFSKNLFVILGIIGLVIIESCASSQKLVSQGKYSDAVDKAVKELKKDPYNQEEQNSLFSSFDFANRDDLNEIKSLKVRGDGESLIKVFRIYERLDERAQSVSILPRDITDELNIYDFGDDLQNAVDDACGQIMDEAFLMLQKGNLKENREAYDHLQKADEISPGCDGLER